MEVCVSKLLHCNLGVLVLLVGNLVGQGVPELIILLWNSC
jgi:hypothetical protein